MKAAIYRESGKPFVLETVPDPVPGPGEAIIKVCRCGICGSDIHMTSGTPFDFPTGLVLGHEYAGEVVDVGAGVKTLKVGDRVTAVPRLGCGNCPGCDKGLVFYCVTARAMRGGFGEYTPIAERSATILPESLTFTDGALVEPLACGARAVQHSGAGPGTRALVIGAGAMGLGVTWWSRMLGVEDIVVSASSERRRQLALDMGASDFLVAGEDLQARAMESLGGPVDLVFECAGADSTFAQAIGLVKQGGTVVVLGACTHNIQFMPVIALGKEVRIQYSLAYTESDFQRTVEALASGAVEPRAMVQDTISLDALPARLEAMRRPHAQCKVMVDPWL